MEKESTSESSYLTLPLALGSDLLVDIVTLKLRIKSKMVGMEPGQYIIIKLSPNDLMGNFRSEMVRESPMIIRYLYKGTVYGFSSQVINVVSAPAKIFFVSYPNKIDEFNIMNKSRFSCILPAHTMFGNDIAEMVIVDISREGCQCVIKTASKNDPLYNLVQINKKIDIKAQFPGSEGKFDLVGKVRNISKDVDKITLGVMFEEMSPEFKAKLEHFISLISGSGRQA